MYQLALNDIFRRHWRMKFYKLVYSLGKCNLQTDHSRKDTNPLQSRINQLVLVLNWDKLHKDIFYDMAAIELTQVGQQLYFRWDCSC